LLKNGDSLGKGAEEVKTAEDIRRALKMRYPDVHNDLFSLEHSGFVHEHPLSAIGVVLISSLVLGTTDVNRLADFTRYSKRFIRVIASNMENSCLWTGGKYDCSGWSSGNSFPRDQREDDEFWDHVLVAEGSQWMVNARSPESEDACAVFWNEKLVN
jgi:hypothetical protein